MLISQLPPPQPGWAQQYNEYLQPAWARTFEPPSVCPSATLHNINSLLNLFLHTSDSKYLEPIPDAIRWIKDSKLPNGKWGRFLEIGTNKPLYYDRGRIRVDSLHQLSLERRTGYGYETDIENFLKEVELRYLQISGQVEAPPQPGHEDALLKLLPTVNEVINSQDELGRWIVFQDKFRKEIGITKWNGEYRVEDRISCALFNRNVNMLCHYLELYNSYTMKK